MPAKKTCQYAIMVVLISFMSSGCVNHAHKLPLPVKGVIAGAGIGAGYGAVAGSVAGSTALGALVGGTAGTVAGLFHQSQEVIIHELMKENIQYVAYGDTHVLIVPTDHYFEFNTHRFLTHHYVGLMNAVRLLRYYPCSVIHVAGFTDEIGARQHKNKLSQSRAEAILTFLWAHDIHAQRLHAAGYGAKHTIGDNHFIHGSAYNRRIEIQWFNSAQCKTPMTEAVDSK